MPSWLEHVDSCPKSISFRCQAVNICLRRQRQAIGWQAKLTVHSVLSTLQRNSVMTSRLRLVRAVIP